MFIKNLFERLLGKLFTRYYLFYFLKKGKRFIDIKYYLYFKMILSERKVFKKNREWLIKNIYLILKNKEIKDFQVIELEKIIDDNFIIKKVING